MFALNKSPITANVLRNVSRQQTVNQSMFAMLIAKLNKIYHGTENPIQKRDEVLEACEKAGQYRMPKVYAKTIFLREKARARVLENNEHYRKLETKISGNAYGMKSMQHRF